MQTAERTERPAALSMLSSERPRNVGWLQAAGLLFGDWGTSRLYVLGLALFFAGRTSFWLILMMSILILAVAWAYSQICRIYPDGGGVYTAAKSKSQMLAVVGVLLLFADYTITASLSALDGFHYFGFPFHHAQVEHAPASPAVAEQIAANPAPNDRVRKVATEQYDPNPAIDAGSALYPHRESPSGEKETLFRWDSPALWAIIAIAIIGAFNLLGPSHTGGFAIVAALGMVFITMLITVFALVKMPWSELPHRIAPLDFREPGKVWVSFVSIVLALSGVEAIANLTGVMKRPVTQTARRAIYLVAGEVVVFNLILAVAMLAIPVVNRDQHLADMAAFLTGHYVGAWGEWAVRIVGGLLLLSAANTAIAGMISVQYLLARDGELPQVLVKLNRFGVPTLPAVVAAVVPIFVLLITHDIDSLAALYAIGVIGAVAINVTLCSGHPRLRRFRRKVPMLILGIILLAIWVTLAFTKLHALVFVCIVLAIGLTFRQMTKMLATRKGPRPSLLHQAIREQLTADAWLRPKILVGTYGSDALAPAAVAEAKKKGAVLVVCFIRQVSLSIQWDAPLNIDTDLAALKVFSRFLDLGHAAGVTILPSYDSGDNAAELMAETAAMTGCTEILIGTSRKGALYHLIKGSFQQRLEALLPEDIAVHVISAEPHEPSEADAISTTISH